MHAHDKTKRLAYAKQLAESPAYPPQDVMEALALRLAGQNFLSLMFDTAQENRKLVGHAERARGRQALCRRGFWRHQNLCRRFH